jgi:hypothetical protein
VPDESDFRQLFDSVSNWNRWGEEDSRGTLNTITPDVVARALGLPRTGQTVSCSRSIGFRRTTTPTDNVLHLMTRSGAEAAGVGEGAATDWVGVGLHGWSFTHLDAHSHVFWDGRMYNGRSKDLVTTQRGALAGGVEPIFPGVVTRGILVDGPALLGVDVLPSGYALQPADLSRWFDRAGVRPEPGDVVYVRTGFDQSGQAQLDERPTAGLAATCVPMLRHADISVLVSDGISDVYPSEYPDLEWPVHILGLVAMGLWMIDNAHLGRLAETCAAEDRYEFLTILAPVPFRRATGSLVNPIAVF